jgi:NAD(P)-dependent dehydrogenase (short-subunit alcohol dehydrogenase family)
MPTPVLLLIAAGPNIGAAVAKKFADNGYKIALAARSLSSGIQANGYLHITADLSNPESVSQIFGSVRENYGIPSIVVYNGLYPLLSSLVFHTSNR